MAVRTDRPRSLWLQAEEAPDARGRFQDPWGGKIADTERQQTVPDSPDHVRLVKNAFRRERSRTATRQSSTREPKALSALDPGVVLGPVSAQAECRLEGAVAEPAEARQDCSFIRGGWAASAPSALRATSAAMLASKRATGPATRSAGV